MIELNLQKNKNCNFKKKLFVYNFNNMILHIFKIK